MHIVIIGSGMAGLTTAFRLSAAGLRVTVLERQSRVGGRALTLRAGFSPGLVAQAGSSRFPGTFARVKRLATEFGLDLAPFYPSTGRIAAYLGGVRQTNYYPAPHDFWGYTGAVLPRSGKVARLLSRALHELRVLGARLRNRPRRETFCIRSGTESLAEALAARTNATFRMGATACSITQDGSGAQVLFTTEQGAETLSADYVVCAVPLSIVPDLEFTPPLHSAKAELAEAIPFASAVRIFLEMRRPYWREQGFSGFAITDTVGEVWDANPEVLDGPTLLVCYAREKLADRLRALQPDARIEFALAEIERLFPGAHAHFVRGASHSWREEPWVRGAWPLMRGRYEHAAAVLREPHGRVFFAGDYATSPGLLNMTEGAIESAENVVAQIIGAQGVRQRAPSSEISRSASAGPQLPAG